MKRMLSVVGPLLLAACAHSPFVMPPPRITSDHQEIPGILEQAARRNLSQVTLFVTHGMGRTEVCFADDVATLIDGRERAPNACLSSTVSMPVCLTKPYAVGGEALPVRPSLAEGCESNTGGAIGVTEGIRRFGILRYQDVEADYQGRTFRVRIYSYWWDADASLLQSYYMSADELIEPGQRVPINAAIKAHIINDGFSDAVLYTGTFGAVMRDGMRNALCLTALERGAQAGAAVAAKPAACARLESASAGTRALGSTHIALMTSSLGSRILFDALDEGRNQSGAATEQIAQVLLRSSPVIYMSANQLPLLGLGQLSVRADGYVQSDRPQGSSFLERYLGHVRDGGISTPPNSIVAFFDPNDLLGYRAGGHLPQRLNRNIIEVEQHYARRWRWLANPMAAHDQSFSNARSRMMIRCGAVRSGNSIAVREPC